MTPEALFENFAAGFAARRFSAGLLIAFIDFYTELGIPAGDFRDLAAVLARFPQQMQTAGGKRANTLILQRDDGSTLSLRPFYNAIERHFRAEHHRFDYPSCAPHATQAWQDYRPWLDALAGYDPARLATLRARVVQFVLDTLVSQAFDPAGVRADPPLFLALLEALDFRPGAREAFEAIGLKTLSRSDLLRIVGLWDPQKQRIAVTSLIYYARHVEKNAALGDRIDAFLQVCNPSQARS